MANGNMEMFMTKGVSGDTANECGIKSSMIKGIQSEDISKRFVHPLQGKSVDLFNKDSMYKSLRDCQGLHAPLKLEMEKISIKKAMTRLPCLPSSNFALDILNGHDADIFPKDFLSDRDNSEIMGDPHLMMEHKLGLKPL